MAAVAVPVVVGLIAGVGKIQSVRAQSQVTVPLAMLRQMVGPAAHGTGPDRIVMLFDLDSMDAGDRQRARDSAEDYIRSQARATEKITPNDVSVFVADGTAVRVLQDFTADRTLLLTAVERGLSNAAAPMGQSDRFAALSRAAQLLAPAQGEKRLLYYSGAPMQSGTAEGIRSAIVSLGVAQVAVFPIDVRSAEARLQPGAIVLMIGLSSATDDRTMAAARVDVDQIIERLLPEDQVGILTLHRQPDWTVPLQKAGDKAALKALVAGIRADGGGLTAAALAEAYSQITASGVAHRHIVLVTDGSSEARDSLQIANDARAHGVTISAIGLMPRANMAFLQELSILSTRAPGPDALSVMIGDVQTFLGR